jgi:hypothetical protein
MTARILLAASMIALGVSPRQGNDVAASLAKAEAAWKAHQPRSYEFTISLGCFCPPSTPPTFRVTDGKLEPVGSIDAATQRRYSEYNTIEKLFAALRSVAAAGPHKMIVTRRREGRLSDGCGRRSAKDALDDQSVSRSRISGSCAGRRRRVVRAGSPVHLTAVLASASPRGRRNRARSGLQRDRQWRSLAARIERWPEGWASGVGARVAIAPSFWRLSWNST